MRGWDTESAAGGTPAAAELTPRHPARLGTVWLLPRSEEVIAKVWSFKIVLQVIVFYQIWKLMLKQLQEAAIGREKWRRSEQSYTDRLPEPNWNYNYNTDKLTGKSNRKAACEDPITRDTDSILVGLRRRETGAGSPRSAARQLPQLGAALLGHTPRRLHSAAGTEAETATATHLGLRQREGRLDWNSVGSHGIWKALRAFAELQPRRTVAILLLPRALGRGSSPSLGDPTPPCGH
uniref:Uncharacterized protein n=1 Tax=Molossus molossus TaxID=27622 RepID=A0A7J8I121_MOLMO|nr:hypothetical protein HJG59_010852 [Molossus molossus]